MEQTIYRGPGDGIYSHEVFDQTVMLLNGIEKIDSQSITNMHLGYSYITRFVYHMEPEGVSIVYEHIETITKKGAPEAAISLFGGEAGISAAKERLSGIEGLLLSA